MVPTHYPLKRVPPQKRYCNNGHMGLAKCNLVRVRHGVCCVSGFSHKGLTDIAVRDEASVTHRSFLVVRSQD